MLSLQNAGKRFGPRVLFLEANWLIRAHEKTALVGANGTGKSTLMKVLAGLESLDYGTVQQTRGMSFGYLPQEGLRLTGRSVFEECLSVFDELRDMEREIERLAGQLAVLDHAGPEYESAAERFSMLQERFHSLDGYALDAQVGGVLTGLGFDALDCCAQTPCHVEVKSTVEVTGPALRLVDVLSPDTCPEVRAAAAAVRIGEVPSQGSIRVIPGGEVDNSLQKILDRPNRVERSTVVHAPERIVVRRAGFHASCEEIEDKLVTNHKSENAVTPDGTPTRTVTVQRKPDGIHCGASAGIAPDASFELERTAAGLRKSARAGEATVINGNLRFHVKHSR